MVTWTLAPQAPRCDAREVPIDPAKLPQELLPYPFYEPGIASSSQRRNRDDALIALALKIAALES